MEKLSLTVVMPALNEGKNIGEAVQNALAGFARFGIDGEIVAVDDGSSDKTGAILAEWSRKDSRVRVISHPSPRGIGASFWDGVDQASKSAVVMLPGDNENIPGEILKYLDLMDRVDIVVPFVVNRRVRSTFRNALSSLFRLIVNASFGVSFNYTNGTCLYRRSILKGLGSRATGFFYQTDILVRLAKRGYLFAEVPYELGRHGAHHTSKALSLSSLLSVAWSYARLFWDVQIAAPKPAPGVPAADAATLLRRGRL